MKTGIFRRMAATISIFFSLTSLGFSQNVNLEEQRSQAIKDMAAIDIPDPKKIEMSASQLFALPLDQQSEEELKTISRLANSYANFIGYIEKEYRSHQSENYRYDFITKELSPILDKYVTISNRFKNIRDMSNYNLGEKASARGDNISAFFYYNDVYRLGGFECAPKAIDTCLRRKAEIQMQKLLQITGIAPYTTWQKK